MWLAPKRAKQKRNNEEGPNLNTLVLEANENEEMPMDVYQKLASDRILFIGEDLHDDLATDIVATLLLKDTEDAEEKITLFINSSGGDIRNALMIYDIMSMIRAPIKTVCIGAAVDEAVILLSGGTPGMRFATKHAIIAPSQLQPGLNMHTDLPGAASLLKQHKADNDRLMDILAKTTKKTVAQVRKDFDRRTFFNASQAVKYGLIDKVAEFSK